MVIKLFIFLTEDQWNKIELFCWKITQFEKIAVFVFHGVWPSFFMFGTTREIITMYKVTSPNSTGESWNRAQEVAFICETWHLNDAVGHH